MWTWVPVSRKIILLILAASFFLLVPAADAEPVYPYCSPFTISDLRVYGPEMECLTPLPGPSDPQETSKDTYEMLMGEAAP